MSKFYKIEGENEFAYFRANFNQLRQILLSDSNWAANVVRMESSTLGSLMDFNITRAISATNIVEQGDNYFVIRGAQGFFYRFEALDANTTRIRPEGRIWGYLKFVIPVVLLMWCVIPVVLTPLFYGLKKKQALNQSKHYLKPLCEYLVMRSKQIYEQNRREISP